MDNIPIPNKSTVKILRILFDSKNPGFFSLATKRMFYQNKHIKNLVAHILRYTYILQFIINIKISNIIQVQIWILSVLLLSFALALTSIKHHAHKNTTLSLHKQMFDIILPAKSNALQKCILMVPNTGWSQQVYYVEKTKSNLDSHKYAQQLKHRQ